MKQIVLPAIIVFTLSSLSILGQDVISTKTTSKNFRMTPEFVKPSLPPVLYIEMDFVDANENGVLEAEESSLLKLKILNKGKGNAQGIKAKLINQNNTAGLKLGKEVYIREIYPDETKEVIIPIDADLNLTSGESKIQIQVTEHFGYDLDPAFLVLNTYEYQKPKLVFAGMEIFDSIEGTFAVVKDGLLQPGEKVKVKCVVQNIGNNIAKDVQYNIESRDVNIFVENSSGLLGDLKIGEVKEFWMSISPNKRVNATENLPLFINITDSRKGTSYSGSLIGYNIPISLNKKVAEPEVYAVKADINKIKVQVSRFEYNSDKYKSQVSAKNINLIPKVKSSKPNAVAVVIGVEKYKNIVPAPFASNDAKVVARYFKDVLGIPTVITHIDSEVSGFFFDDIFNPQSGQLAKIVDKDKTDLYIYYSGHGIPEKDGKDVYLFPFDGKVDLLDKQGYSLNTLYQNLSQLNANSVTVILDACFSGSSRATSSLSPENLSNTKGVKVRPRRIQPWLNNPKFTVITSSTDEQTSLGFEQSETGLFTYYFALGLQGEADTNNDKKVTLKELTDYIFKNVTETSKKIRGEQTPQFYGLNDDVLVEF